MFNRENSVHQSYSIKGDIFQRTFIGFEAWSKASTKDVPFDIESLALEITEEQSESQELECRST